MRRSPKSPSIEATSGQRCEDAKNERQKHVDAILNSSSRKKIVVAGPGTGKTYLFKEILKGKTNALTLTFVNTLVEDLSLDLCGLSHVRTLHGYARSELSKSAKNVKVFPKLSAVIKEDASILLNQEIDFDRLFHDREDENDHIHFYKRRKDYYGYYGYSDIIFALVKHFEKMPSKIPAYEQVVVDEFQDFNKLEVSLIDLLARKSPVLLAGDDDQALYAFKNASPEHIREKHGVASEGYASFSLPYCSRCTRVIVEAVNDIIDSAKRNGHLGQRISKAYQYFEDKRKNEESKLNPKIIYARIFAAQIPWLIQRAIGDIAEEIKTRFSVLIISPFKLQARTIAAVLKEKGLENLESVETNEGKAPSFLDGLTILLEDDQNNLGWRIVSKSLLENEAFYALLKRTDVDRAQSISEIIGTEHKVEVTELLQLLREVQAGKEMDKEKLERLFAKVGLDPHEIATDALRLDISPSPQRTGNPAIRKIQVKATTIPSSKGLAADYVFITHFDDRYFIKRKNEISDQEICNFLVALTRAKKRVFLISSDPSKDPTFLTWIKKERIEERTFKRRQTDP